MAEWITKLWDYTSMSSITSYLKRRPEAEFNSIWRLRYIFHTWNYGTSKICESFYIQST